MSKSVGERSKAGGIVHEIEPGKAYATSVRKVARHFGTVPGEALVRDLAEAFRRTPDLAVVAVVDGSGRALGLVHAQQLFSILGKPFGYDVLSKTRVAELAEATPRRNADAELFTVAAEVLADSLAGPTEWILLEELDGRFAGAFSVQDLAAHLSGMTRLDVERAGALQERLMAGQSNASGRLWRVEAWSRMAKGIGGDLHFARRDSESSCFCSLCDVSGKGVEASVLVSMAWGMQRMYRVEDGLSSFLRELNRAIVEAFHLEKYLTGFFMEFDREKLLLRVADMGHSHVLVFRGGRPWRIRSRHSNLPLGLAPDLEPGLAEWTLRPGDVVFVFSDGFVEQEDGKGAEFGEARLAATVSSALLGGASLADELRSSFDAFRSSVPQQDDVSFLALHVE